MTDQIKSSTKDRLRLLEGSEVMSVLHGGVVGVVEGQLWMDGKMIDGKPSEVTLKQLIDALFVQEFGMNTAGEVLRSKGLIG